jgi:hypothetical protein
MGKRFIAFTLLMIMAGFACATILKWTNSIILSILPFPVAIIIMGMLIND